MSETTETKSAPYTEHQVWQDEQIDEAAYLPGHIEARRATAACNYVARTDWGLVNLLDDREAKVSGIKVKHSWWKDVDDEYMTKCGADDEGAQAITEVHW